ncbi:MAG TPA: NAD(P)/FAD-dependent oxidoreductase, partial [Symbiobacteriaceae bacterium]|nr:NAD(P)/FAD-dependent oxidoreductase [Symbiobacteriaceae bacterium]
MSYDLIVIGGGPGGYVAAIRAAQHGMKVALVEGGTLGGTCLNVGCIPSKALIETAHALRMARDAASLGVRVTGVALDFPAMIGRQRQIVRRLTQGVAGLLRANGVTVIAGWASIAAPGSVAVTTNGASQTLTARRIMLATGSEPVIPPVPGLAGPGVGTSDTVWALESLPPRVLVVGGGVIGIEMASLLGHLGSQVTVVELLPAVLPAADAEATAKLVELLSRAGVTIRTQTRLDRVEGGVAHCSGPDGAFTVEADYMLVAAGRRPRLNRENLDHLGVAYGPGGIEVNAHFETTVPGIYAIGDVAGGGLAHAAMAHALACVDGMAGHQGHFQPNAVPA